MLVRNTVTSTKSSQREPEASSITFTFSKTEWHCVAISPNNPHLCHSKPHLNFFRAAPAWLQLRIEKVDYPLAWRVGMHNRLGALSDEIGFHLFEFKITGRLNRVRTEADRVANPLPLRWLAYHSNRFLIAPSTNSLKHFYMGERAIFLNYKFNKHFAFNI